MLYNSNDYDLIVIAFDDNSNVIAYECIYYINGRRCIDVYEYPPCDWEM